jgi:nucleotide-binding universal stress UspA family protein
MSGAAPILAATDLSAPSRHAVERAGRLAARCGTALHVVHALELDALDSMRELMGLRVATAKVELEADARRRLSALISAAALPSSLSVEARLVSGTPLDVVTREANARDVSLVVLGAQGESFLRHAILGSTAARLLRKSGRFPILVVRQSPRDDYRAALVPVDFSPVSLSLIHAAQRWAPGATLVLLHAFELPYEGMLWRVGISAQELAQLVAADADRRRVRLHDLAASAGLRRSDYELRVLHGDPIQQILGMEQEIDAELIVLGKHGTHLTEELLLGSVTRHVLAQARGDVLVIADPRGGEGALT